MTITVVEGVVLGLGVIGAVVAGNAAHTIAQRNGCSDAECLATSCVATGLSMAVLPVAAVAGAGVIVTKGFEAYKNRDVILGATRAKHAEAMTAFRERFPKAANS